MADSESADCWVAPSTVSVSLASDDGISNLVGDNMEEFDEPSEEAFKWKMDLSRRILAYDKKNFRTTLTV